MVFEAEFLEVDFVRLLKDFGLVPIDSKLAACNSKWSTSFVGLSSIRISHHVDGDIGGENAVSAHSPSLLSSNGSSDRYPHHESDDRLSWRGSDISYERIELKLFSLVELVFEPFKELRLFDRPLKLFALRLDFAEAADKLLFDLDKHASTLPLVLFPDLHDDLFVDATDEMLFGCDNDA